MLNDESCIMLPNDSWPLTNYYQMKQQQLSVVNHQLYRHTWHIGLFICKAHIHAMVCQIIKPRTNQVGVTCIALGGHQFWPRDDDSMNIPSMSLLMFRKQQGLQRNGFGPTAMSSKSMTFAPWNGAMVMRPEWVSCPRRYAAGGFGYEPSNAPGTRRRRASMKATFFTF